MFGGVASNLKTIEINLKKLTLDITVSNYFGILSNLIDILQ